MTIKGTKSGVVILVTRTSPWFSLPRSLTFRISLTCPEPIPGEAPRPFTMGSSSTDSSGFCFAMKVTALVCKR